MRMWYYICNIGDQSKTNSCELRVVFIASMLYVLLLPPRVGDPWHDRIHHAFFWKGTKDIHGGLYLINWKLICSHKNQEGVGICNLWAFNFSLLYKCWWRLFHDTHNPWVAFILHNCYRRRRSFDLHHTLFEYVSPFGHEFSRLLRLLALELKS